MFLKLNFLIKENQAHLKIVYFQYQIEIIKKNKPEPCPESKLSLAEECVDFGETEFDFLVLMGELLENSFLFLASSGKCTTLNLKFFIKINKRYFCCFLLSVSSLAIQNVVEL